ncbi:hypothetical protein PQQ52_01250 [Paraburkholderia sediminicola]|uniref:hypothetical protein n=1 Tax=Paraburkholderia sediminicola TaxID=458836 RepID=UPI0038BCB8BE
MDIASVAIASATGKLLVDKAKDVGIDLLIDRFKAHVIGRWSKHRAEVFLAQLVDEVRKQGDENFESANLNDLLKKLAGGDAETSLLFDAYRRIALCASKDIGPMVIGVLTAVILQRDSRATDEEEQMFMAAESLNDRDFIEFIEWFDRAHALTHKPKHPTLQLPTFPGVVAVEHVTAKATRNSFTDADVPVNLFSDVGPFAPKLANLGIVVQFSRSADTSKGPAKTKHFVAATHVASRLYAVAKRVASDITPLTK